MGSTYNEVSPLALGKSRNQRRSKDQKTRDDDSSYVPAPPPESPPLRVEPPGFNTASIMGGSDPLQTAPTKRNRNGINNATSFMASVPAFSLPNAQLQRSLPIPSASGTILEPQAGKSMNIYGGAGPLMSSTKAANNKFQVPLDSSVETRENFGLARVQEAHLIKGNNKKRKMSNNMKSSKQLKEDASASSIEEQERRKKRAEKFRTSRDNSNNYNFDNDENFANLNAISTKSHKFDKNNRIIGLCQDLEKSYLRLTSEPNPNLVRPLTVLKKTYALLMNKHKKKKASYQYLCDQFKSMRQDLRVQMIENQFTVKVYESHARIALENGDIGEFNQCQSRLIVLFELSSIKASFLEEFTSYRILYYTLTEDNGNINMLRLELIKKNPAVFSNRMVKTAFDLAHARLMGDYHNFMKIYVSLETLGKKLVDAFIEKEYLRSLVTICKSYNQINLDFLVSELKFEDKEALIEWFRKRELNKFLHIKNQGEENEYQLLDTKACRHAIIRQYSGSKAIDIRGQQ